MTGSGERILLVESDPDISDQIAKQVLKPLGYQVVVTSDASTAIKQAPQFSPDLIIINVDLPGLSGKDLLVALTSQGFKSSYVLLAEKGKEHDIIMGFRLGATDYLLWPARDAEIATTVERALKQVRETNARQRLNKQLEKANQELEHKVRALTSIVTLGKAVVSITEQRLLLDKIVESALQVSEADLGWLLLRDDHEKKFILKIQRNMPPAWAKKIDQPLDDGISSLVALSGEALTIHGEPIEKLKVSNLGKSAAVTPIKARDEVIGMLVMARKNDRPFEQLEQSLLGVVADYASISLVNAQLFRALEQTAKVARQGEENKNLALEKMSATMRAELKAAIPAIELLMDSSIGPLNESQQGVLKEIRASLHRLARSIEKTVPPPRVDLKRAQS
jgi:DNA-binding response OmpR family regulator